jgi:SAM-dependent methyltransferase
VDRPPVAVVITGLVKYSSGEHEAAYLRIEQEGLTTWSELHGTGSFEDFPNRRFLEMILPRLALPDAAEVLEYGCGTGPAACFLASLGHRVHGIDFVPKAIELARRIARQRGLSVDFEVRDVCDLPGDATADRYDLVLDSFCLQSVVTDSDRDRLFAAVRDRIKAAGYYVISTAMYDPARRYGEDEFYDAASGVCYTRLPADGGGGVDGDVSMHGAWYRPHRRHLTPGALRDELDRAGFSLLWQGGELGGDLVCACGDVSPPADAG